MAKIVIIGAGITGSIAARLADARGHDVTVIDNRQEWAASKASGCVLAPSWLSSLDAKQIENGMGVLKELFTVHDIEFTTNLLKKFKAQRVDLDKVLVKPDLTIEVVGISPGKVALANGDVLAGRVLVAAGIGCARFFPDLKMRALWGASLRFAAQLSEPRIHVYAPYRQAVAFNRDGRSVWMGDGTALVQKTWEKKSSSYLKATEERAEKLFGLKLPSHVIGGARPQVAGHKAGYSARVMKDVWVATGAAKNGTILAAAQAYNFMKEVK